LKFLLFLLALLFGVWLWRRNRLNYLKQGPHKKDGQQTPQAQSPSVNQPSPMLACKHCGVRMPESDMFKGKQGVYCTPAHCQADADQAS
jgi:uncharacterized protein